MELVWERLNPAAMTLVLSAFLEGKRAAMLFLPHDRVAAYYWGGVSDFEFRKQAPNNILQWEAIKRLRERGIRTYDLVSTYGGPGLFKRSFGPEAHEVATHWERSSSRLVAWLRKMYERRARARTKLKGS